MKSIIYKIFELLLCLLITLVSFCFPINGYCETYLSYKLPLLPVSFSIDSSGKFSISGEKSIVTPFGTFSIGTSHSLPKDANYTLVIVRNMIRNEENVFKIYSGEDKLVISANGMSDIEVKDRCVLIKVSKSTKIYFNRGNEPTTIANVKNNNKIITKTKGKAKTKTVLSKHDTKAISEGIYRYIDDTGIVHFTDGQKLGYELFLPPLKRDKVSNNMTKTESDLTNVTVIDIDAFDTLVNGLTEELDIEE